jgi:hypothetical protein
MKDKLIAEYLRHIEHCNRQMELLNTYLRANAITFSSFRETRAELEKGKFKALEALERLS